ncbi:hypothetical protein BDV28DRAFT_142942 [Aspergillus coremiiformis]|uniref:MACPF domain-containing protein n=1 Tax=Aspergillus coremiiformis TaxID=138285 RepID=A0A5N6YVN7_9EURO|nr:hypothetical protein BDV28DRAFT_142942 [Aspergillus coremiiformis]
MFPNPSKFIPEPSSFKMGTHLEDAIKDTAATVMDLGKDVERFLISLADAPQQVLHVYSYNDQTKTIEEISCIPFKKVDLSKTKLADIRELLVSENVLEPRLLWSAFCNQRGAKVLDTVSYKAYLGILNEKSSGVGDITADNADTYRVYLKSEKNIDHDYAQSFLDRGVRIAMDKKLPDLPAASQPKAPELPTSFSHNIFVNPTTTFAIVHPADMSETHWSVVIRNNSLLNGYRIYDAGIKIGKVVERSMHTAFVLKPRPFLNHQISASAASDAIAKHKQMLKIPRFRIDDDSYIEQFEKTKSVTRAIAQNSLSQFSAELAVEGGAFGCSAGLSASYGQDNSSSSASSSSEDTRVMTITYNFPRVVIDFDRYSLDLSDECKLELESVDSAAGIDSFKDKYGRFFATRVELGGRLHSSEESTATTAAAKADQAKSMRAAAALSFSSPFVQASANASYGKSSQSSSEDSSSSSNRAVCWEAKGGDTLQCNDPTAWAYTVGSFYNWRVVKQSRIVSLEDVIATIPGYQDIKQKFTDILKNESKTKATATQLTIGFKLSSPYYHKDVGVKSNSKDGNFIQNIFDLATEKVMTEERVSYLKTLSTSISGATPLELQESSGSNSQKFYVNVESTESNEDKQLQFDYPYRIYNKSGDQNTWLSSNPILSGYLTTSLIWAGNPENATSFQFLYPRAGHRPKYIQNGDPTYLVMLDKNGQEISWATPLSKPSNSLGTDVNETAENISLFSFKFNYV